MRYLGLDVGARFIGVAVGEALARELTTLQNKKGETYYEEPARTKVLAQLQHLLDIEEADAFVIGLPVNEQGQPTEESQKITTFAHHLEESTNRQVHFVNETLTSFMAEEILEGQGVSPQQVKQRVHQASAQLILQQYFEENGVF